MSPTESVVSTLQRNWAMVDSAMEGLDQETINRIPAEQCNSIAWILWHMSRVVDTFVNTRFQSRPQLWIAGGWHQRFGMGDDPDDRGVGWTMEQVASWSPPDLSVQLGYHQAVREAAAGYLSSATEADLAEVKVIPPAPEPRTVANALGQMVWDAVAHGGQIAYLRGFYRGMGWHR